MGRPRKNKTVVEVAPEEQIQQTSFKIKLTNLRTATYPDALVETDFQKFKIGELLVKGVSKNTVYEIVNIFRGDIYTWEGDLESKLAGNLEATNLLKKYRKSNNFGVCYFSVKCIARNGVQPKKSREIKISELRNHVNSYCRRYEHYDIDADLSAKLKRFAKLSTSISVATYRKNTIDKQIVILKDLKSLTSTKAEEIEDQSSIAVPLI